MQTLNVFFHTRAPSAALKEELLYRKCQGDVTRGDSQGRFLAQRSVGMLDQYCNHSKRCRSNIATLHSAKNRRCESSRVTSLLGPVQNRRNNAQHCSELLANNFASVCFGRYSLKSRYKI